MPGRPVVGQVHFRCVNPPKGTEVRFGVRIGAAAHPAMYSSALRTQLVSEIARIRDECTDETPAMNAVAERPGVRPQVSPCGMRDEEGKQLPDRTG